MKEPQNSWEISYIISVRKPHVNLFVSKNELFFKVGHERAAQLRDWADRWFDHRWFLEHI